MKNKGIIAGAIASIGATVATYLGLAEVQKEGLKQAAMDKTITMLREQEEGALEWTNDEFMEFAKEMASYGNEAAQEVLDKVMQAGVDGANAAYAAAPTLVGTCAVAAACIGALLYYRHRQKAKEAVAQNAESLDM